MITDNSRRRREAFCRKARRRDASLRSLYAGSIHKSQHHQQIPTDMPTTVTFNTQHIMSRNDNKYRRPLRPAIDPGALAPARIFEQASLSYVETGRPANSFEIYGVALGTCCLALLLGWILLSAVRESLHLFHRGSSTPSQRTDTESGYTPEREILKESGSFLSNLRNVSSEAEELIKSAQRVSVDAATVLKRDMGELRLKANFARRRKDEEEGLGDSGGYRTLRKCSFLPKT